MLVPLLTLLLVWQVCPFICCFFCDTREEGYCLLAAKLEEIMKLCQDLPTLYLFEKISRSKLDASSRSHNDGKMYDI